MPLTFLAHQVPVLPVKVRWGTRVDGTALCIGSMTPDFAYPLGVWMARESHTLEGALAWSVPAAVVITLVVRAWVARVAFAHLPDAGPLRLRSYRVLGRRRPPLLTTVLCAVTGVAAHLLVDSFTHSRRMGARLLGFDRTAFVLSAYGDVTVARVLQVIGHTVGTAAGLALLASIGRRRLVESWYGEDEVTMARGVEVGPWQRVLFWAVVAAGLPAAAVWAERSATTGLVFTTIDALAITTAVACALPWTRPRPRLARSVGAS